MQHEAVIITATFVDEMWLQKRFWSYPKKRRVNVFILPGYTEHFEEDGILYVSSKLFRNNVKISDKALQKEFYELLRCGGCASVSSPLTKLLHEQGLIGNEEEISAALSEAIKLLNNHLLLTIMPTEGCNFRCPYCYESHTPISMTRSTIDKILKYISERIADFQYIHVGWFGGEPTLCKDTILECNDFIQNLSDKFHCIFQSNMTTNGYLLDEASFKQYYLSGITSYQVTLDGWEHDKTRPHISGKKTLDTIIGNLIGISKLPKEQYQFNITLRRNILENDNDMSWYDYLHKLFGADERFKVAVYPVGNWGGETVEKLNLIKLADRDALLLKHIDYLDKIGMRRGNGRCQPFEKICYACYPHSMVFRASGKIEKCTVALDEPKNLLGRVDDEEGVILNEGINRLWSSCNLKKECYTCPDVLSCFNLSCKKDVVIKACSNHKCTPAASKIY